MERILVSVDVEHGMWEALSRACSLAKRIEAKVYVLLVLRPPFKNRSSWRVYEVEVPMKERLKLMVEEARGEGISVDYFIMEGDYEEEVIRFIQRHGITLLVTELMGVDSKKTEKYLKSIINIPQRTQCRVELVHPKKKH